MLIHKCDLCNQICENATTVQFPLNEYIYAMSRSVRVAKFKKDIKVSNVEICPSCTIKIANILDSMGLSY